MILDEKDFVPEWIFFLDISKNAVKKSLMFSESWDQKLFRDAELQS